MKQQKQQQEEDSARTVRRRASERGDALAHDSRAASPGTTPEHLGSVLSHERRARWVLPLILLLAFVLRLIYVLQSRANPYFAEPQMDAGYHVEWARALVAGRTFQAGPFFRAPLYPWFLALCFDLFGESYLAPRIVQAVIGTIGVGLVYLVGTKAFDRRVGWLAALFAASYWVLIYFDGELLLPVLEVPFDLLAIWLSLRIADRPTPARAAAGGFAWGVAAIVRPNVLLFAPLVGVWILWITWKKSRALQKKLSAPIAFVLGLLGPILPITAYNTFVGGDAVLVSSQGGVNLWIGNNPQSDGSSAIVPGTRADWWGGYNDAIHQAESATGKRLKPSEVSSWYTRKAIEFVRENPGLAWHQFLWKLRLFWTDWELGNNADERFFAYRFGPLLRLLPIGFALLAALGLVGFFASSRRFMLAFPLWAFLPVYMLSVVAFFVCSRFRVPVLPVLSVFAAHACIACVEWWREKRFAALAIAALAFGILFVGVSSVPRQIDRTDSNGLWLLGVHEVQHGNLEGGAEYFSQAIDAKPRNFYAQRDLGLVLKDLGRYAEAEGCLRAALAIRPDEPSSWRGLIDLDLKQAHFAEAKASARLVIAFAPYSATAQFDLGWVLAVESVVLAQRGASAKEVDPLREEALAAFHTALSLHAEPDIAFECGLSAGRVLSALGRWREAVEALTGALKVRELPDVGGEYWECQKLLLNCLVNDGRATEARTRAEELRRRFPNDPAVQSLYARYSGK